MSRARLGLVLRAVTLALAVTLAPRAADAEEPAIVTVVRTPGAGKLVDEATVRLVGELEALGFTVRSIDGTRGADGRAEVERASGELATIAILATDRGTIADVWVADNVSQKTLVRRVDLGDTRAANAASDLAVRSTELLRASLLEVLGKRTANLPSAVTRWIEEAAPRPATPVAPPAPPPAAPALAPPAALPVARPVSPPAPTRAPSPVPPALPAAEPRGLAITAGAGLFAGGFGVAPSALLRLEQALPWRLSIRASLLPGVAASRLTGTHGSASLRETAATLDVAYDVLPSASLLHPTLALGGGFYHVAIDGNAVAPAFGLHRDHVTVGLSAAGGLGLRLAPGLLLRAELDVLVLAAAPIVTVLGEELGRTGRPTLLPSLGLELRR